MTEESPLHIRQAEGLRRLADMIEQNPQIAGHLAYALDGILSPVSERLDAREQLSTFARVAKTTDAEVTIKNDRASCAVFAAFGPVRIEMYASAAKMAGQPQPTPEYEPLAVD
ncbi:hypothetical protein AB0L41_42800 [Amycolatopsis mediterranei]|uniref:hypothetical protein n=1 Tax=Amycolatopsis mediterranei TaxID=33910 RepID=UPI003415E57C